MGITQRKSIIFSKNDYIEQITDLVCKSNTDGGAKSIAVRIAIEKKYPKNKYSEFGKVVKFTKDGMYVAIYKNCYKAGKRNGISPRRIYKCCTGKKGSTGGYRWMFQEDCHTYRLKVRYWCVEKTMFNLKNSVV